MSASREKNKRKEQAAVPETANEAKKGMSKGLKTTLIAVCTVLVVCIVVFFYMLTSGFFASHTTARDRQRPQPFPGYGQLLL